MMRMRCLFLVLSPLFLLFSTLGADARGDYHPPSECSKLHVQIQNATANTCELINRNPVRHGIARPGIPLTLIKNETLTFDVSQTIYGPDVVLEYRCDNGKQVMFESQQNLCVLSAGTVTGHVLHEDAGIHVQHQSSNGSYFWSQPGMSVWTIRDTQ